MTDAEHAKRECECRDVIAQIRRMPDDWALEVLMAAREQWEQERAIVELRNLEAAANRLL